MTYLYVYNNIIIKYYYQYKLISFKASCFYLIMRFTKCNSSFELIMNVHWHMSRVHVVFMTISYFLYYLYAAQITYVLMCDLYKQCLFTMSYV